MLELSRPAWMEINLDDLIHNCHEIRQKLEGNALMMAIVKADAYETGAIQIVKTLMEEGIKYFGVATLSEALHIRKYIKTASILVMGYTPEYLYQKALENNITLTLYSLEQAQDLDEAAIKMNKRAKIHIKIETGMNRLGFAPDEKSVQAIAQIDHMKSIEIQGIFTHFAASDDNPDYTRGQVEKYDNICDQLKKQGIHTPLHHVNNSAAIMNFPQYSKDMVRAGVILYGIYPFPEADRDFLKLRHILSIKAQIAHIKEIEPGEKISYGLTYTSEKKAKIATLPLGYADGYSRALSNKGHCIVNNHLAPIVGRICMDQLMIDVTGIDASLGDEVILMGKSKDHEISIYQLAQATGQIPAEVQCLLNKRFPRVYMQGGQIIHVTDYVLEI